MSVNLINEKTKKIPPHLLSEVMDYIDYLINKYGTASKGKKYYDLQIVTMDSDFKKISDAKLLLWAVT